MLGLNVSLRQPAIFLCHAQAGVSQHCLDAENISAILQGLHGESAAQGVRRDGGFDARFLPKTLQQLQQPGPGQWAVMVAGNEKAP